MGAGTIDVPTTGGENAWRQRCFPGQTRFPAAEGPFAPVPGLVRIPRLGKKIEHYAPVRRALIGWISSGR